MIFMTVALSTTLNAQTIFWIENFNNGCTSLCTSYNGPNGAWVFSNIGPASACGGATTPNLWYISCAENGNAAGTCGSGCGNDATLHVGNDPLSPSASIFCPNGDCGAAYDAGGYCDILSTPPSTITSIVAASPAIDCSGRNTITLTFNYIERGQGSNDNATVSYYDGSSWTQLADMTKTPTTCGAGQGRWTSYSIALPASADNNPNVAIAFNWENDDDGSGNDPSFAVDSVRLTVPSAGVPPLAYFTQGNPVVCYMTPGTFDVTQIVSNANGSDTLVKTGLVTITPTPFPNFSSTGQNLCVGDCIDYTDLSTGTIQSYIWTFQGGTPLTSSDQNPTNICYNVPGSFNTTLLISNGSCINSNTHVGHIIVTQPTPPTITMNGDTLLSTPALTYQWYQVGMGPIPSGIFQFLVATPFESYYVCITDPMGCSACSDTINYIPESVHEFDLSQAFNVYPNPVQGRVVISNIRKVG